MRALLLTTLALVIPSSAGAAEEPLAKPVGWGPLTSWQASQKVIRRAFEPRPENHAANHSVPTTTQIQAWRAGHYLANVRYVNGRFTGTTDEIIQWASRKWGFSPRVLRSVAVQESSWRQSQEGDFNSQTGEYDSFGLFQMRRPYHFKSENAAELAMVRGNTAFCADYYGAILRAYYDGTETWLNDQERGQDYAAGDVWGGVGAWYSGRWHTPAAEGYISLIQGHYAQRPWWEPGF